MNFSIVLIAKNEEKTLPRMLESLKNYRDKGGEIIIVDTGSTDNTVKIAKDYNCIVDTVGDKFRIYLSDLQVHEINSKFCMDESPIVSSGDSLFAFADARNYAASLASNDMISNQDCDEVYSYLDISTICNMIDSGVEQFVYNFIFSHTPFGKPAIQFDQSKFYNRKKLYWKGIVHEVLQPLPGISFVSTKRVDNNIITLEHWQNPETPRGNYLKGLALDCFLNPDNDRNSHYLGRELLWTGRPKSAIKELTRHVSMNKWNTEAAQSMIFIGDCYGKLGDIDSQIYWYWKGWNHEPLRNEALLRLGSVYRSLNQPQKCLCVAKAAMEIPWGSFYANQREHYENIPHELAYWSYGWLGNINKAQEHILKALEYQPRNTTYLRDTKYYFEYPDNNIEGWMSFSELQFLYNYSKYFNYIAEIGSWKGRSTHALCSGCKGVVTAIDHFLGSKNEDDRHQEAKKDLVYPAFLKNMKNFTNLQINKQDSLHASLEYMDNSFDMIFIDGEHTYEGVKSDIQAWKNKARILLCGHDYCDAWPDVKKAVDEELGVVNTCDSIWYKWMIEFPKVSIVIPTLGREDKLRRCISAIREHANYTNYEIIVEHDSFKNRQGVAKTLRKGIDKSKGDYILFLGNDTIPQKDFLFLAVMKMLVNFTDKIGLIGLNDMYWHGEFATHFLIHRTLLDSLWDGLEDYKHCGIDNEITERCRLLNKYIWCEESKVFHEHPFTCNYPVEYDEVYTIAYNKENLEHDRKLLKERSIKYGFQLQENFIKPN